MICSFPIDASVPVYFWLDAAHAAVYTINRLPTSASQNKTPFEILFQGAPHYSFLKPFCCTYFPNFVASFANKLQAQSVQCLFLGYVANYKGYRCLDPISGRVYVSCHVRFLERHYSFS